MKAERTKEQEFADSLTNNSKQAVLNMLRKNGMQHGVLADGRVRVVERVTGVTYWLSIEWGGRE